MQSTIQIRIDESTKKKAKKILDEVGLDLSSGIKLFLSQVVIVKGIPFLPSTNAKRIRARWDREVENALKKGKGYASTKKMLDDILGN
jgi:DNA-damage-inducible protein J